MSSVIESFFNEIKNQSSIRVLRTNNVLKYVKNNVFSFLRMKLFIKHLALTRRNKIMLLNANIDIFWMSLGP